MAHNLRPMHLRPLPAYGVIDQTPVVRSVVQQPRFATHQCSEGYCAVPVVPSVGAPSEMVR